MVFPMIWSAEGYQGIGGGVKWDHYGVLDRRPFRGRAKKNGYTQKI